MSSSSIKLTLSKVLITEASVSSVAPTSLGFCEWLILYICGSAELACLHKPDLYSAARGYGSVKGYLKMKAILLHAMPSTYRYLGVTSGMFSTVKSMSVSRSSSSRCWSSGVRGEGCAVRGGLAEDAVVCTACWCPSFSVIFNLLSFTLLLYLEICQRTEYSNFLL